MSKSIKYMYGLLHNVCEINGFRAIFFCCCSGNERFPRHLYAKHHFIFVKTSEVEFILRTFYRAFWAFLQMKNNRELIFQIKSINLKSIFILAKYMGKPQSYVYIVNFPKNFLHIFHILFINFNVCQCNI